MSSIDTSPLISSFMVASHKVLFTRLANRLINSIQELVSLCDFMVDCNDVLLTAYLIACDRIPIAEVAKLDQVGRFVMFNEFNNRRY